MCCYFLNVIIYINIFHTLKVYIKCTVSDTFLPIDMLVPKYCPETPLCPFKGSHIMCQNNIPFLKLADSSKDWEVQFISIDDYCKFQHDFGESCYDKQVNITMHPDLASQILVLMNAMRSKVAKGKEISKADSYSGESFKLPRGYSMWKLEWDSELATFAQIWANQCIAKYDFCHASEKFPYSTQIIHDLKFDRRYSNELGDLKPEELGWAINVMFKSIYETKNKHKVTNSVTHLCLLRCSEPLDRVYNYLQIINGANTHVGCGLSLSKIRENAEKVLKTLQWRLLLVCNFSHRTLHMHPLYTMVKPESNHSELTFSTCGCPTGSIETPDCLCQIPKRRRCKGQKCKPEATLLKKSITSKNDKSTSKSFPDTRDGTIVVAQNPREPTMTMLYFGDDIRLNRSRLGRERRVNSIYSNNKPYLADKAQELRGNKDPLVVRPYRRKRPERSTRTSIFLKPQPFSLPNSDIGIKNVEDVLKTIYEFTNLENKDNEYKLLDFVNEVEGNLNNTQINEDTKDILTKKVKRMQYITETRAHSANKEKRYDKDIMNVNKHHKYLLYAAKQTSLKESQKTKNQTKKVSLFLRPKPFVLHRIQTEKNVTRNNDHIISTNKPEREKKIGKIAAEITKENQIFDFLNKLESKVRNAQLTEDTKNILKKKIRKMQILVIDKQNSNNENSDADNQEIELFENFVNIHKDDKSE